jgi:hypothetical protein
MQGRDGGQQQYPADRSSTAAYRFARGQGQGDQRAADLVRQRLDEHTGMMPALPRRPAGMTRLDQPPPPTPRIGRPQYEQKKPPTNWKKRIIVLAIVFGLGSIFVGVLAYGVTNLVLAMSESGGAATRISDFLSNVQTQSYDQAFQDLDATITVQMSSADFTTLGKLDDKCYGQVTNYSELANSSISTVNGTIMSFTYTMMRSKYKGTYSLKLTVQKDAAGNWSITSFGGDLGPAKPTC